MTKTEYHPRPVYVEPTQQEVLTLSKLRAHVSTMNLKKQYNDEYLLRFVRARRADEVKTIKMWDNFIQWRKDNDIDNIKQFDFHEILPVKKCLPHGYFRTGKLGHPVYIERFGMVDPPSLWKVTTRERFYRYYVQGYERLVEEVLPGCGMTQTLYIMDMQGWQYKMMYQGVFDFIKSLSKIGQDNYPEVMYEMFLVNTPFVFLGVWNIVKFWVDEKTRSKVKVLGKDFQHELLLRIEPQNLPDFLGGTATVEEYGENLTIEDGPWLKNSKTTTHQSENRIIVEHDDHIFSGEEIVGRYNLEFL
jgi:hypothetical protein